MKKYFLLAMVSLAMASCGSSETKEVVVTEEVDTFGMEMPIEALESTTPYEGTGNMSDGAE